MPVSPPRHTLVGAGKVGLPGARLIMYDKIISFENLLSSYRLARRGNRYKTQICKFDFFLENNLLKLRYLLQTGSYTPLPYTQFVVEEPKKRNVSAPDFRDRVLHHALVSVIGQIFDKTFINDAYACRKEKGTHYGMRRVKKFLQSARTFYKDKKPIYILQCDIRKFFPSISWDVLLCLIGKKVACPRTMRLIEKIVTTYSVTNSNGEVSLPLEEAVSIRDRKGLPIGNLTSQLFANVFLNPLDHFVKEVLRERWYGRYMDDFLIIHPDKAHLKEVRGQIRQFLEDSLKLSLHQRKTIIQNVGNGVPFVGYRIFYDHVLIRGSTLLRFRKNYRSKQKLVQMGKIDREKFAQTEQSFGGHLKHANAWNLRRKLFA